MYLLQSMLSLCLLVVSKITSAEFSYDLLTLVSSSGHFLHTGVTHFHVLETGILVCHS